MKPEIKERWLKALRSGEYAQGANALRTFDYAKDCATGHCCLGVLCDLHSKETGKQWTHDYKNGQSYYFDQEGTLPPVVRIWAGLLASDPILKDDRLELCASVLNDGDSVAGKIKPRTFLEIANLIEAQL